MSDLPAGWAWTTVADVAEVVGGIQKSPRRRPAANAHPMLRVANVLDGQLALDDVHQVELFDGELERLSLEPGDCLVVEGNGSISQVGRAAMWRGEIAGCVHQNHILRARPLINPSFLLYWMMSPAARDQIERLASSTSGLYVLSGHKLRQLALPVPGLREQTRIVTAIEEYLSLLDDGVAAMQRARLRMKAFRKAAVDHALSMASGAKEESGHELFTYVTSGSRGWAKYYSSVGAAFVRVGNVPRDAIQLDLSQVQMVDPPEGAESYRTKVQVGDLLITITADIGRVAVAPADLGEAYINQHVAIARPHVGVNSAYLAWFVASTRGQAQLTGLQRGMTKAGLGLDDIRALRVPVPPLDVQERVAMTLSETTDLVDRTDLQLTRRTVWAHALRRSILSAAFSGELAAQDPDDEPASVLLESIGRQRSATPYRRARTQAVAP